MQSEGIAQRQLLKNRGKPGNHLGAMDDLGSPAGQHGHVHGLANLAGVVGALGVVVKERAAAGEKQERSAYS